MPCLAGVKMGLLLAHFQHHSFDVYDKLWAELNNDPTPQAIQAQLAAGSAPEGWSLVDGMLLFKGRHFVPNTSTLWP